MGRWRCSGRDPQQVGAVPAAGDDLAGRRVTAAYQHRALAPGAGLLDHPEARAAGQLDVPGEARRPEDVDAQGVARGRRGARQRLDLEGPDQEVHAPRVLLAEEEVAGIVDDDTLGAGEAADEVVGRASLDLREVTSPRPG